MNAERLSARHVIQNLCAETRSEMEIGHALDARRALARIAVTLCDDEADTAIAGALARAAMALNEALALMEMRDD